MNSIACHVSEPWLCIGDFNELLSNEEACGGNARSNARMKMFRDFIFKAQLIDLGVQGSAFTWFRKKKDGSVLQERLDRALVNDSWCELWPQTELFNYPNVGSDHAPVFVCCSPLAPKAPKLFRFEECWKRDPECLAVVSENWKKDVKGSYQYKWRRKLNFCRNGLKKWSRKSFGNSKNQIDDLMRELNVISSQGSYEVHKEKMEAIISKLDELWCREEVFWHQRSRVKWLRSGDKNSKFFHLSTIQRRHRNKVRLIKGMNGDWLEGDVAVSARFTDYFKQLFSSDGDRNWDDALDCVSPVVTPEMNEDLIRPVSEDEVRNAVFQLGALKAPGPDGFQGTFYQTYWEVVSSVVSNSTREFMKSGSLLHSMNKTHIVLIPKVANPDQIGQFRPISLCNFSYKVLSKVLANRLRVILPALISFNQAAFVQDRQIQDNIVVAHEVFH